MEMADLYDAACMIKELIEENQRLKKENSRLNDKIEECLKIENEILRMNEDTYDYMISFMLKVGDKRLKEMKGEL